MDTTDKQKKKSPQKPKAVNTAWVSLITVISFALSVVMSYISNEALASAGTILSFAVLLLFIALGIVFDMIGVASTSATEKEFHSMAAHRVRGAREAVWMVRNAEKVSSSATMWWAISAALSPVRPEHLLLHISPQV